jgi:hypothetical protein
MTACIAIGFTLLFMLFFLCSLGRSAKRPMPNNLADRPLEGCPRASGGSFGGGRSANPFTNTEPRRPDTLLAVVKDAEASKGLDRDGHKPLMRNRYADDGRSPIGNTASNIFPTSTTR